MEKKDVELLFLLILLNQIVNRFIIRSFPGLLDTTQTPLLGAFSFPGSSIILLGLLIVASKMLSKYRTWLIVLWAGVLCNLGAYYWYGYYQDVIPVFYWSTSTADLLIILGCLGLVIQLLHQKTAD